MTRKQRPPRYKLEINNFAPDIIEYRAVGDLDWTKVRFPEDAYFFTYYDGEGRPERQPVTPWYYLSTDPRVLGLDAVKAEFPEYAELAGEWSASKVGVSLFAVHAYDCGGHKGRRIIPLLTDSVLVDARTLRQVWPEKP